MEKRTETIRPKRRPRYSLRDRRKLIAFQNYLERTFPITIFHVVEISDYVKLHFVRKLKAKH
jgi:hypothetical protein